jgi:cytochrome c-type biogenesis protein CcmH/NrfF
MPTNHQFPKLSRQGSDSAAAVTAETRGLHLRSLPGRRSFARSRAVSCFTYLSIFAIAIALLSIPPLKAQQTDHAKQLGMKLMCICGCGQVLVQCNHIGCPSSVPMLKELDAHIARAESDDLIVQDFVQEYGVQVLSAPPHTGFNAIAWFLPGIAFAIGLSLVLLVIARWRKRKVAAPVQPTRSVSPEMLARAREIADRATED